MDYVLYVASLVAVYGILTVSLNLVLGYTGILSVAHAAFMGIGAYATALLLTESRLNFFATLPAGLAVAGLVGAALAASTLRLKGDYYIIGSFGFQVIIYNLFLNWIDLTKGPFGIRNIPKPRALGIAFGDPLRYTALTVAFLVATLWVARRVAESPYGKVLRAIREDEAGAASIGKNVRRYKVSIFVVSAMLASVGGALYAGLISYVDPFAFTINESIFLQALVIIGGAGNVYGSVVGAVVLIVLPELLRFFHVSATVASPIREIAYGTLMILFLRFRPKGLVPELISSGTAMGRPDSPTLGAPPQSRGASRPSDSFTGREQGAATGPSFTGRESGADAVTGVAPYFEVTRLAKAFGGLQAVDDVTFSVAKGTVTSLIGPNGAGKTTVFDLISGFVTPDRGRVHFKGRDITRYRPHEIVALGMARTFQHLGLFYQLSVWDNVFLALPAKRRERLAGTFLPAPLLRREEARLRDRTAEIIEFLGLGARASEPVANLSWGDQKLVCIGRLLATDGDFLLMDEPAAGLSDEQTVELKGLLKTLIARGKTVLIIDHNMEAIMDVSDWVLVLNAGRILATGRPAAIQANEDVIKAYLGV